MKWNLEKQRERPATCQIGHLNRVMHCRHDLLRTSTISVNMAKQAAPKWPKVGSVAVEDEKKDGETQTRRNALTKDALVTQPMEGIETTYDVLSYAARTHGTNNALGWRDIVDVHEEKKVIKKQVDGKEVSETKTWKYFQLSGYKYLNFVEVKEAVLEISAGLAELGIAKGEIFNVYSATWYVANSA